MPPGRPRGSHEIAGKVRRAFDQAVGNLKRGGVITDLSDIWAGMIVRDPYRAFDTLAKFLPKELLVEKDGTHRIHQRRANERRGVGARARYPPSHRNRRRRRHAASTEGRCESTLRAAK